MKFSWAGVKNWIVEFWQKLTSPQKVITIVAPLLVLTALISLVSWAGKIEYVSLFNDLTATEAGQITNGLKDLNVGYKLENGGSSILVPKDKVAEVRLGLANAGLPQGSQFSFDYLNQTRLGETDSDRKIRYTLALQNELETTLKTMAWVKNAWVNVVMPEQSLFAETQNPTTAAVTLELAAGASVGDQQVKSIANLLASSVEGLAIENVTIVDTKGNTLSDVLANNDLGQLSVAQLQYQQQVEENTQKKVQSMLDKSFNGKTVVRVNASIDFDKTKIVQETHGPGAIEGRQETNEMSSNTDSSGGVTGITPNVPGYETPVGGNSGSYSSSSSVTENRKVDTTQQEKTVAPGAIKRLSISVMADADTFNEGQLEQIKALVSSAAGLDETRGDQIQVAALPFDKSGALENEQAMADYAKRQQLMTYIELGLALLLVLVLLVIFLRAKRKKKKEKELAALDMAIPINSATETAEMLMAQKLAEDQAEANLAKKSIKSAEDIQKQKIKEAVDDYSRKNPDEVARLVKSWLAEEK